MSKTFVGRLIALGVGTAALGAYILFYRPWQEHWGATEGGGHNAATVQRGLPEPDM